MVGHVRTKSRASGSGVGFGEVFRVGEFRWLFLADIQSQLGDQLARVALSVLVFARSGSVFLTAAVFAVTFLPAVLGGLGLGHLADIFPRRTVLVTCDAIRAVLLGLMAIPCMPIAVVVVLLVLAVSLGSVFGTAESALVTELVDGERYAVATSVRIASLQISQLVGFAGGGVVVAWLGARPSLGLDAATFLLSAVVIRAGVRARQAALRPEHVGPPGRVDRLAGFRAIVGNPQLRLLLGLSWLSGFTALPEGLAVPYAHGFGGGAASTGLLLAANPAGTLVGTLLFVRLFPAASRRGLVGPLAVAGGLPLIACAGHPGLTVTVALWACTGLCAAYHSQIPVEFVQAVPNAVRGQAIGIASSGLYGIQGLGLLAGGLAATSLGVAYTVAASGGGIVVLGAVLATARRRRMLMGAVTEVA